jgi:hypothetical protein
MFVNVTVQLPNNNNMVIKMKLKILKNELVE